MISIFTVSMAGCKMIEKTPEAIKKSPVAKIGKETITRGELDEKISPIVDQIKATYGENYENNQDAVKVLNEQKKLLLDSLIADKVFISKGEQLKVIPEKSKLDEEIKKRYDEVKAVYGNDDKKFEEALKQAKLTEEVLKGYLKDQIVTQKVKEYIIKDVKVDDKEIEKFYNDNKATLFTEKPGAKLAHILVKTKEEADKIKAKIDNKEDFAKLAKEFGTDGTKETGGVLEEFTPYDSPNYDKDFMEAAKKLNEGEVSAPVKTKFGYHIIKATNVVKEPKVQKLEDVKEEIKAQITKTKQDELIKKTLEDWKKELKVKIYDKNI